MALSLLRYFRQARKEYINPYEGKDTRGPCAVLKRTEPSRPLLGATKFEYVKWEATDIRKTWMKNEVSRNKTNVRRLQKTKV